MNRKGTGAVKCPYDPRDRKFGALGLGDSGDPELESDLKKHVRLVRDQGKTSTCGGQAFAGAIDVLTNQSVYAGDYGAASALFIYYPAVRKWADLLGVPVSDDGIDARSCAQVLSKQGCCNEASWPFDESKVLKSPPWSAIFGASARAGCQYGFVRERGEERLGGLASALHAGFPVVVGLDISDEFVWTSGKFPIGKPSAKIVGAHFVLLIGRKLKPRRWLGVNSWGKDFGAGGFFELADYYVDSEHCWDPCVVYGFERVKER